MLTKEENDLLTQTGPGTPCGELMRRYWQPAALSEELPSGGAPLPIRLLGEDLVLFRDPSTGSGQAGRPGLLGLHCSHRGADLSYGRIEDGGLRCIYHGWLYDIHGRCLDPSNSWTYWGGRDSAESSDLGAQGEGSVGPATPKPGRAAGDEPPPYRNDEMAISMNRGRRAVRHPAYPCVEKNGVIFTYMGPGDPPLLPSYDFLLAPEEHVFATKIFSECNYLQGNEGNIDLLHVSFLHYNARDVQRADGGANDRGSEGSAEALCSRGSAPYREKCEAHLVDVGLRVCKIRALSDEENWIRVGTFIMPNSYAFPAGGLNWHVPIDDTHHWKYVISFDKDRPYDKERLRRNRDRVTPPPEYKPIQNKANRYQQDRARMAAESYSGLPLEYFAAQDLCATEGAGPIQDRTQEHLGPNDAPVVIARKMMLGAIAAVQEGRDPPGVIRDRANNDHVPVVATHGVIPSSLDWNRYCEQLLAAGRGWIGRPGG